MMTSDSTSAAALAAVASGISRTSHDPIQQLRTSMLQTLRHNGVSTLKYLGTTEVHTYAFSVAANAIATCTEAKSARHDKTLLTPKLDTY